MGILQRSRKRLRVKLRVMNERSGSLSTVVGDEKLTYRAKEVNHFCGCFFRKKLSNFYTFRSFVWPKSGIITLAKSLFWSTHG